jgi:ketosteroid isomerase-like protein
MDAVTRKAKDEWLALFAEDAVVEDPVGPSMFDAAGKGHHGREGISAFWDMAIAGVERFEFTMHDSFAAGSECANVGVISAFLPGGARVDTEGVFVYRVGEDGLIRSVRAFWETERAMATFTQSGTA